MSKNTIIDKIVSMIGDPKIDEKYYVPALVGALVITSATPLIMIIT